MGRATFARVAALHRGPTDAGQRAPASSFVLSERLLPAGLGPAGAGKTTVMKLVARAVDAASGRLIPLAPSCRAAKVFGDGLRLRAYILRSWLHQRTRLPACPTGSDGKFGPGYAVPDSDGHAASSHIGASGPPGMTVYGAYETFCADPTRKGPDAAGGYTGPKTVGHGTSSAAGRPRPRHPSRLRLCFLHRGHVRPDPQRRA
ncbi:AAA family ATPase, partial [Streptomyces olivaceoviridis]